VEEKGIAPDSSTETYRGAAALDQQLEVAGRPVLRGARENACRGACPR